MTRSARAFAAALAGAVALAAPPARARAGRAAGPARALLERAVAAAGGAARLDAARAFRWHGKATIHLPEGGEIHIAGTWGLEPPDTAILETYETGKGPDSMRRMFLTAARGWTEIEGKRAPLDPALVAHEHDQFYLYFLMRLAPLLGPGFAVTEGSPAHAEPHTLHVTHASRRDADLTFDAADRLVRILTTVEDPGTKKEVIQDVRLAGQVESHGVRWPRAIAITWDGKPYFDLEISDFEALPHFTDPRLSTPP